MRHGVTPYLKSKLLAEPAEGGRPEQAKNPERRVAWLVPRAFGLCVALGFCPAFLRGRMHALRSRPLSVVQSVCQIPADIPIASRRCVFRE